MKILFFIESLHSGGKERRLVELIKGLKQFAEIEMELVLMKEEIHYSDIFSTEVKIHYTIRRGLKKDPRVFYKFYKIAKEFRPDIINAWGNMVAVYSIPTKILLRSILINNSITYAVRVKENSSNWFYSLFTFFLSDKVIANSYAGLKAHDLSINSKYKVIHNGYNFDRCSNNSINLKDVLGIRSDAFLVGMIASLTDAKDHITLLKSAKDIQILFPDIHFLIIGDGPNKQKLINIIYTEKIHNVHMLDEKKEIEAICNELNIGVLLSNTNGHAEGISNSVMELMAASVPVVATNAGGTPEIIEDGETGFLIRAFDSKMLTKQIIRLYHNEELRCNMGQQGKAYILKEFNISKMINAYYSLFSSVLTNKDD